jgi:hypothetical protein
MATFSFAHWLTVLAVLLMPVLAVFVLGWRATRRRRPS